MISPLPTVNEASARLESARHALDLARGAEQRAVEAFDLAGDATSAKALARARDDARLAGEHVGRAERQLEAARSAAAEQARVNAQAELEAIRQRTSHAAVRALADASTARVVEALKSLAELLVERHRLAAELDHAAQRGTMLLEASGVPTGMHLDATGRARTGTRVESHSALLTRWSAIAEALNVELATLQRGSLEERTLRDIQAAFAAIGAERSRG